MKAAIAAIGFVFLSAVPGYADLVEWELPPEFLREYRLNDPLQVSADFDLGVTFSHISHVYIDWEGEITGGMIQWYDWQTLEPVGEPLPASVGINATLGPYPHLRSITLYGGGLTYPDPEPFDCVLEYEERVLSSWSDFIGWPGQNIHPL